MPDNTRLVPEASGAGHLREKRRGLLRLLHPLRSLGRLLRLLGGSEVVAIVVAGAASSVIPHVWHQQARHGKRGISCRRLPLHSERDPGRKIPFLPEREYKGGPLVAQGWDEVPNGGYPADPNDGECFGADLGEGYTAPANRFISWSLILGPPSGGSGIFTDRGRLPMQLSYEDGQALRQLQLDFDEDNGDDSLFRFVFKNAPDSLASRFLNKKGAPSEILARRAVQALTVTTAVKVSLRPNPTVVRKYMEPNFTASRYATNFVNGTNRTISSWNYLPEDVRREFIALNAQRSWDDPFEERVAHIQRSAAKLLKHFRKNPYDVQIAQLKEQLEERIEAYEALVRAYEESGKKGKRPKRPSTLAREFKRFHAKGKKWQHKPEFDAEKIERFVRVHDQMRMLSEWGGSKVGRKPSSPQSYPYVPLTLIYPGTTGDEGRRYGWNTLCVCLLDDHNIDRVVASGERLDLLAGAYRQCVSYGVSRFTKANDLYLKYLSAKKQGKASRKAGAPTFKTEARSFNIQDGSVSHGGPASLEEGSDEKGRWTVRCNACDLCRKPPQENDPCQGYLPRVRLGGMRMALGKEAAEQGIRISRAEYRRIRRTMAHGGRISEVIISRETSVSTRHGIPEAPRTTKTTQGRKKRRKRSDCGPKVRYFASLVLSDIPAPAPRIRNLNVSRVVGVDPGARKFLTLSDGTVYPDLQIALKPYIRDRARLQRRLSRWSDPRCPDKWRGRQFQIIKRLYTEACDKVARMRRHMHEQILDEIFALPYDVVAFENTALSNLTRSAKGTAELPAAHGQAKAARERNRKVLAQGIGGFRLRLLQRAKKVGKVVVLVEAAYTSQICHSCKAVHSELGSNETFSCPSCGHEVDRDANAALNIRDKGVAILKEHGIPPVGGKCLCTEDSG